MDRRRVLAVRPAHGRYQCNICLLLTTAFIQADSQVALADAEG